MSMSVVDDYLASLPEPQRQEFERLREIVRSTVPDVEESTSYGMPAFKYRRKPLLGFRASKNHLSVVPFSAAAIDAVRHDLRTFDLTKGTVRFTPERPLPTAAVERLLQARLHEIETT